MWPSAERQSMLIDAVHERGNHNLPYERSTGCGILGVIGRFLLNQNSCFVAVFVALLSSHFLISSPYIKHNFLQHESRVSLQCRCHENHYWKAYRKSGFAPVCFAVASSQGKLKCCVLLFWLQRSHYTEWKHKHSRGWQAVVFPDGTFCVDGPFAGYVCHCVLLGSLISCWPMWCTKRAESDSSIYHQSGLCDFVIEKSGLHYDGPNVVTKFWIAGDDGYSGCHYPIITKHRNVHSMPEGEEKDVCIAQNTNFEMIRAPVEWLFGGIKRMCRILEAKNMCNIGTSPVDAIHKSAFLLYALKGLFMGGNQVCLAYIFRSWFPGESTYSQPPCARVYCATDCQRFWACTFASFSIHQSMVIARHLQARWMRGTSPQPSLR